MPSWKCHCLEPATFVVHAFSAPHSFIRWNKGEHLKDNQHGMYACCDEHLTIAVKEVRKQIRYYPSKIVVVVRDINV